MNFINNLAGVFNFHRLDAISKLGPVQDVAVPPWASRESQYNRQISSIHAQYTQTLYQFQKVIHSKGNMPF